MMGAPVARLSNGLGSLPRAVRAGVWIGCALAVLYALTLLTAGRSDGEWTSPPRRSQAAVAPAEAPATAWTDARAPATLEPTAPVLTTPGLPEPQEASVQPAAEPAIPVAVPQSAKPQSRGMKARRASRGRIRHAREPIQFRLADRPGM
jgi:hypothetical protein